MTNSPTFSNRKAIEAADVCGCASCLRAFSARLVGAWTDDGDTGLCPFCGIDAVVPAEDSPGLDVRELLAIHREEFLVEPENRRQLEILLHNAKAMARDPSVSHLLNWKLLVLLLEQVK